jgi:hypothetical protein
MGIPEGYKDADCSGKIPTSQPKLLMLPLTKEQLASKECVEEQATDQILTVARPPECEHQSKIVHGCPWRPGIY